jgi:hypothetical protein
LFSIEASHINAPPTAHIVLVATHPITNYLAFSFIFTSLSRASLTSSESQHKTHTTHPKSTMPSLKSTLTVLALSLFANNAFAGWAQFCNDDNCSEGCGAAVDLDNPGCLNQYNRRSIKFSGTISQDVNLVASPNPGCDCQNYCEETIQRAWTGVFDQRPSCFTLRDEAVSFSSFLCGLVVGREMYADFGAIVGSIFPFPWCSTLRCGSVLSLRRCVSAERVTAWESGEAISRPPQRVVFASLRTPDRIQS